MEIQIVHNSKIKLNKNNPRFIKTVKYKKLVQSIIDMPNMLKLRPIIVDNDYIILGGNMRYKACIEAGLKLIPIIVASDLTDKQKKEFIIKDNINYGDWDWDILANDYEFDDLDKWSLDLPSDMFKTDEQIEKDDSKKLCDICNKELK